MGMVTAEDEMASTESEVPAQLRGESRLVELLGSPFRSIAAWFQQSRLEVRFIIIASLVVLTLMVALAFWTTRTVENAILKGAGTVDASYLQTFVTPLLSVDDVHNGRLTPELRDELRNFIRSGPISEHVKEIKLWTAEGQLFHSASGETVGDELSVSDLRRALEGEVSVSRAVSSGYFAKVTNDEYIEIYAPLLRDETGKVILVGEFYERPNHLKDEIHSAWRSTMTVVLLIAVPMLGLLFIIVREGSLTIDQQNVAIRNSLTRALKLSAQNRRLKVVADHARLEAGRLNEKILGQIGSDLHDGPIQIQTLLILRLTHALDQAADSVVMARDRCEKLLLYANQAMKEIRSISSGLVLPELEDLTLEQIIRLAVERFTDLTGSAVRVEGTLEDEEIRPHLGICVYRLIQEGLANAHRHAPSNCLTVRYGLRRGKLVVEVSDRGLAAKASAEREEKRIQLGKLTQRRRIRAFGGRIRTSHRNDGTTVLAVLPLQQPTDVPRKAEDIDPELLQDDGQAAA